MHLSGFLNKRAVEGQGATAEGEIVRWAAAQKRWQVLKGWTPRRNSLPPVAMNAVAPAREVRLTPLLSDPLN